MNLNSFAIMRLLVAFALVGGFLILWAERSPWYPANATYSRLMVVSQPGKEACRIDDKDRFTVTLGKAQSCWEQVVQAHNRAMESPKSHSEMDICLRIVADGLGKPLKPCVQNPVVGTNATRTKP